MSKESKTITLTASNFDREVTGSDLPVLVDFWAAWCGPCRVVGPIVDAIAVEYQGRVRVGKVNVDEEVDLASRFGISSIPSLLIFRSGDVVDRVIGAVPREALTRRLEEQIAA